MRPETSTSFGDGVSASTAVIDAIADLADTDPAELGIVLYEYVDPDALDALVEQSARRRGQTEIEFAVDEFEVTVRDDGTVTVEHASATVATADAQSLGD